MLVPEQLCQSKDLSRCQEKTTLSEMLNKLLSGSIYSVLYILSIKTGLFNVLCSIAMVQSQSPMCVSVCFCRGISELGIGYASMSFTFQTVQMLEILIKRFKVS